MIFELKGRQGDMYIYEAVKGVQTVVATDLNGKIEILDRVPDNLSPVPKEQVTDRDIERIISEGKEETYKAYSLLKEVDLGTTADLGNIIVYHTRRSLLKPCVPEMFVWGTTINESHFRWTARINLPTPVSDAWSSKTREDAVTLAYIDDPEEILRNPKYWRKATFLLIDEEIQQKVLDELGKYVFIDVEDFSGPMLGAIFAADMRGDSPDSRWNAMVADLREKVEEHKKGLFEKTLQDIPSAFGKCGEVEIVEVDMDKKKAKVRITNRNLSYEETVEVGFYNLTSRVTYVESKLKDIEEKIKEDQTTANLLRKIKNNETPFFGYGDFYIYYKDIQPDGVIRVPSAVVPHLIGRQGFRIKNIRDHLGIKLRVENEGDTYLPSKKAKVYSPLDYRTPLTSPVPEPIPDKNEAAKIVGRKRLQR